MEVTGRVSRWDGTTNVIATDVRTVRSGCNHACLPRLALTFIPVYRDCLGAATWFIINARCVVDIA